MDYKFLAVFFALSLVNVVFATIKTLVTIKGGKLVASLISGGYFAFYNIMMVYTVADFPMWQKCLITFVCNVVGVYVVKWSEEKARKDKLWKVEATIPAEVAERVKCDLKANDLHFNYIDIEKYYLFNVYCETQQQSTVAKVVLDYYNAKYFVSESKTL